MAEGIFPVIEVDAGRQVDIIVTKGTKLQIRSTGNQEMKNLNILTRKGSSRGEAQKEQAVRSAKMLGWVQRYLFCRAVRRSTSARMSIAVRECRMVFSVCQRETFTPQPMTEMSRVQ